MTQLSERGAALGEQLAEDTATRFTRTNKNAMDFLFGAQKVVLEEMVLVGNDLLDRARTEMHLFNEFASKMASAHSVSDVRTMIEECGRHQVEFIRRDSERMFKHGERVIETTSKLLGNWRQS